MKFDRNCYSQPDIRIMNGNPVVFCSLCVSAHAGVCVCECVCAENVLKMKRLHHCGLQTSKL